MRPCTTPAMLLSYLTISLCLACAAYAAEQPLFDESNSETDSADQRGQREISQSTFQHMLAVRSPKYNFGLGKRKYIKQGAPGSKRLPQYNFGLGKRAIDLYDYEDLNVPSWVDEYSSLLPREAMDYDVDKDKIAEKRAAGSRYHFGLGKRRVYDFGLGKRSYLVSEDKRQLPNRYNFGLGRR